MKKGEIRALTDEAYKFLDDEFHCQAAAMRALQVLVNAPDDPESYLLMAEVAEQNGRFDQSLQWINRGLTHFDEHAGLLLKKATILLDGFEDIDEAFVVLSKLRASFSSHDFSELKKDVGAQLLLEVYLLLTDCFRLKTDFNQALECAKLAAEIAPTDENAILGLATAHFETGDYETALAMIEPVTRRGGVPDFYWQKGQILCAQRKFREADSLFLLAHQFNRSRYHRPVRLDEQDFGTALQQALLALPREIRAVAEKTSVTLVDVVPLQMVKESNGRLSPQACISVSARPDQEMPLVLLFQRNIENLASKKVEIKDLIASALLHDLGKILPVL